MQHLKNVENILVLDDGKIKMRGSYDELKEQGLDFDEILKKYEDNKESDNKDDVIFNDSDSEIKHQEDQKNYHHYETQDENYDKEDTLRLPLLKEKSIHSSSNVIDINRTEELTNASAKMHSTLLTDHDSVEIQDKPKEVKMIIDEDKDEGKVPLTIWCSFFNYGLSFFGIFVILLSGFALTFFQIIISYIVAVWTKKDKDSQQGSIYFDHFWISVILILVLLFLRSASIYMSFLTSSVNIHKKMSWKLLRAPSVFFDANPIGRILTRFAKDTVVTDYLLGLIVNVTSMTGFKLFGIYVIIVISVPWMAIPLIINFIVAYLVRSR